MFSLGKWEKRLSARAHVCVCVCVCVCVKNFTDVTSLLFRQLDVIFIYQLVNVHTVI